MSGHTPGPWVVLFSAAGYPYQIHAPYGDDRRAGAVGSSVTRWGAISLPSSAEGLANARLIAASPTMYSYIAKRAAVGDKEAAIILESIHAGR